MVTEFSRVDRRVGREGVSGRETGAGRELGAVGEGGSMAWSTESQLGYMSG